MSSSRTDTSALAVDPFCSSPSIPPSSIEIWISDQLNRRDSNIANRMASSMAACLSTQSAIFPLLTIGGVTARDRPSARRILFPSSSAARAKYNPKDDLLDQEFMLKGKWY